MQEEDTHRRRKILKDLLSGHGPSTAGIPAMFFADDLMDMFPSSTIILDESPGPNSAGAVSWTNGMKDTLAFLRRLGSTWCAFGFPGNHVQRRMHNQIGALYASARWGLLPRDARLGDVMTPKFYAKYNEYVWAQAVRRGREAVEFMPSMGGEKELRTIMAGRDGLPAVEPQFHMGTIPRISGGCNERWWLLAWRRGLPFWALQRGRSGLS